MKKNSPRDGGAALLVSLAFIVIITVLIVGFALSMRIDRPAASIYLEKTRASLYAQTGVDAAVATLQQNTADSNRNWISQPGQIIAGNVTDDTATPVDERKILQQIIPLSSGTAPSPPPADSVLQPCNLNVTTLREPTTSLITDRPDANNPSLPAPMQVAWVYIRKDGAHDPSQQPAIDPNNPIVGRYAYWADDESSKVNYNLAWGRNTTPANTNPSGHPTKVDLTALTGLTASMADAIHGFITDTSAGLNYEKLNQGFFNTPEEARQVDLNLAGVSSALKDNKFEVTHYSNDPDTNCFNEPRIVLTTQKKYAPLDVSGNVLKDSSGQYCFLDILTTDNTDPGTVANLSATKLDATIKRLVSYLKRTDWPLVSGASFDDKFGPASVSPTQRIRPEQLAVNIIEYVRAKESSQAMIEPIRGRFVNGTFEFYTGGTSTNTVLGNNRGVRITEAGFYFTSGSAAGQYVLHLVAEVHLPKNCGIASFNLTQIAMSFNVSLDYPIKYPPASTLTNNYSIYTLPPVTLDSSVVTGNTTINAGEYRKVSIPSGAFSFVTAGITPANITRLYASLALVQNSNPSGPRLDYITLPTYTVLAAGLMGPDTAINSLASNDPYYRTQNNWTLEAPGNVTWGAANPNTLGTASTTNPQQDTDSSGLITNAGERFPPPKGQSGNLNGVMESVGELGFVCTGYESSSTGVGTPYRTLRLQPKNDGTATLPDWALLDLFAAPSTISASASQIAAPYGSSRGGRVNLNSKVEPFAMQRTLPLSAVLLGASSTTATTVSSADAQTLAGNIYNKVLSPKNAVTGSQGHLYGYQKGYGLPGEVAEIRGIADQGEESEALVRDISGLVTTRGNVFSIYSVGQSIKQTSTGKLIITGEQRLRSMVERYLYDPDSNPSTFNTEVRFRTVYFRNLTP